MQGMKKKKKVDLWISPLVVMEGIEESKKKKQWICDLQSWSYILPREESFLLLCGRAGLKLLELSPSQSLNNGFKGPTKHKLRINSQTSQAERGPLFGCAEQMQGFVCSCAASLSLALNQKA